MDALSEALGAVRMTGAIFFNAEFSAPWGFEAAGQQGLPALAPGFGRLVPYHLVIEGEALVRMEGVGSVTLGAGDIVVVPHGDAHTLFNGSPATLLDSGQLLANLLGGDLTLTRLGGPGAVTRFVCGFFGCERHAERLFLAGLPPMFKMNVRGDPSGAWLENSIRHLVSEAASGRPGRTALLSKMAEALFIETLRRYMEQLPAGQGGWLAAARDPVVGTVLALLHRRPCHRWTTAELAQQAGASRSVLNERFTRFLGEPPQAYLSRWRLQLAARLLETTPQTIVRIAGDVGYESEAAFNRAFKREFGLPPAQYRKTLAGGAPEPALT
jgi:AraC-like DNA-binding protein